MINYPKKIDSHQFKSNTTCASLVQENVSYIHNKIQHTSSPRKLGEVGSLGRNSCLRVIVTNVRTPLLIPCTG